VSLQFEISEMVQGSPEQVLDAMLDLERAHLWMPGLLRMERLSPGPLGVGSEWRETRKAFGKEATEQFEVVGLERPHRLELRVDGTRGSSGRGEYRYSYRFEPTDAGTAVRFKRGDPWNDGRRGVVGKLFVGPLRKACGKDLQALRSYVENGHA
jgi:carbon monoxide dehydrogenase subunit G